MRSCQCIGARSDRLQADSFLSRLELVWKQSSAFTPSSPLASCPGLTSKSACSRLGLFGPPRFAHCPRAADKILLPADEANQGVPATTSKHALPLATRNDKEKGNMMPTVVTLAFLVVPFAIALCPSLASAAATAAAPVPWPVANQVRDLGVSLTQPRVAALKIWCMRRDDKYPHDLGQRGCGLLLQCPHTICAHCRSLFGKRLCPHKGGRERAVQHPRCEYVQSVLC